MSALNYIFMVTTTIFPDRSASKAMEKLDNRYNMEDTLTQAEQQKKYDGARLGGGNYGF